MIDRDVVLGHCNERGQSRLRGEQVVVRVVDRVAADVIPDREQLPLLVVQKAEVHLHRVRVRALGDCSQALRVLLGTGFVLHHLEARLLERNQVAGKIAAIHRRDVAWFQYSQLVEIVPVEEVSVKATHSLQRSEDLLHAIDHLRPGDESEIDGAHRREQLQANVGRRCAQSDHWLGIFLEVVGRQPLRLFRHELFEVRPVQLGVTERRLSLAFSEVNFAENGRAAERERDARARHPYQHQRQCPHHEQESLAGARTRTDRQVKAYQNSERQT